mgnify:FL=1
MTKDSPITVVSSNELRMLMTALSARDNVRSSQEIVLHDNAQGYLTLKTWLEIMGVNGKLKDALLSVHAGGGLSRAMANDDLFLRLQMLRKPEDDEDDDYYLCDGPPATDAV